MNPTWAEPGPDPHPVTRAEVAAWVALGLAVTVSRFVVAPDTLYEWDSANYALAIDGDFEIYEHQPHPPGNPGFVLLLRLLSWIPGTVTPFLVANAILGTATIALLGLVLRRNHGPRAALAGAALFAVSPQFWQQGAVATAYVAECLISMGTFAATLLVARRAMSPEAGAVAFSLLLSIRPSAGPSLLPVTLLGILLARPAPLRVISAGIVFGVLTAVWFGLSLATGGGWERWRAASDALVEWQLVAGSGLVGDGNAVWERAQRLTMYVLDGANLLLLVVPAGLLLRFRRPSLASVALWVAWVAPVVAMYVLHHLAKSAYVLTLMPAVFVALVACAWASSHDAEGRRRRWGSVVQGGLVALYLAWNVIAFAISVPPEMVGQLKGRSFAITGDYGAAALQWRTTVWKNVNRMVRRLDREKDLPVWLFGAFESHRIAMHTFPHRRLLAVSIDHRAHLATPPREGELTFGDFQLILLREAQSGDTTRARTRIDLVVDRTDARPPGGPSAILRFVRHARVLDVPLDRVPRRILVFAPCPPCAVEAGERLGQVRVTPLAWDLTAVELASKPD